MSSTIYWSYFSRGILAVKPCPSPANSWRPTNINPRALRATQCRFLGAPSRAAHEWRTDYQRDRDRITHSRAFRRLEYKTQVFLNGTGDHLRTRLTHTIEVAAVSRNIARALGLNEDLAKPLLWPMTSAIRRLVTRASMRSMIS